VTKSSADKTDKLAAERARLEEFADKVNAGNKVLKAGREALRDERAAFQRRVERFEKTVKDLVDNV